MLEFDNFDEYPAAPLALRTDQPFDECPQSALPAFAVGEPPHRGTMKDSNVPAVATSDPQIAVPERAMNQIVDRLIIFAARNPTELRRTALAVHIVACSSDGPVSKA